MIRSLLAPVRVVTENVFRSMAFAKTPQGYPVGPQMQARATADMRSTIAMLLTQLPKPPRALDDGSANKYVVRLTRISPGYTDDDGLAGGTMKAVRDEVAKWIGIDDGHALIRFEYDQMSCPRSKFALRIEVEDQAPGEPVRLELGDLPATIREARPRGSEKLQKRTPAPMQQGALVFRKSWALCPWEQDGTGEAILTPLAMTGHDPPKRIRMHVPAVILSGAASVRYRPGSSIELERHEYEVEGSKAYVYMTAETEERP